MRIICYLVKNEYPVYGIVWIHSQDKIQQDYACFELSTLFVRYLIFKHLVSPSVGMHANSDSCPIPLTQVNLRPEDIRVSCSSIHYGMKMDNPIRHVKFFDYDDDDERFYFSHSERDADLRKPYEVYT